MYGPKLFIVVLQKVRCLPNKPIPCVSPKSISLQSRCTPVSEIREFKRKKNNSEKGFFDFGTFPIVKNNPFLMM